jgi:3-deoxy-D-manno-octulosonate 8-phosphate phosphatase (KDO 8-P phosphatase)
VITGRNTRNVAARMQHLGIDLLFQGVKNKLEVMQDLLTKLGITAEEAGFMGDDIIDLQVMAACGFSATPADSHHLAKRYACLISSKDGGRGAVREVCEFILDAQGKLDAVLAPYLPVSGS